MKGFQTILIVQNFSSIQNERNKKEWEKSEEKDAKKAKELEKEIVAIERKCKEILNTDMKNLKFQKTRLDKYRLDRFSEFKTGE